MSNTRKSAENEEAEKIELVSALVPAALYIRSATFEQKALLRQKAAIESYAARHGMQIVKEFVEDSTTGKMREKMMEEVLGGTPSFSVILMEDVARWGRFRDADETARYEYLCCRSGIDVHYTQEEKNDETALSGKELIEAIRSIVHVHER